MGPAVSVEPTQSDINRISLHYNKGRGITGHCGAAFHDKRQALHGDGESGKPQSNMTVYLNVFAAGLGACNFVSVWLQEVP